MRAVTLCGPFSPRCPAGRRSFLGLATKCDRPGFRKSSAGHFSARTGFVRSRGRNGGKEVSPSAIVLLPYTPSSVAVARRRLTSELAAAGVYETTVCDAALVVSELLSNAIRHAAPLPGAQIRVTWTIDHDELRI